MKRKRCPSDDDMDTDGESDGDLAESESGSQDDGISLDGEDSDAEGECASSGECLGTWIFEFSIVQFSLRPGRHAQARHILLDVLVITCCSCIQSAAPLSASCS